MSDNEAFGQLPRAIRLGYKAACGNFLHHACWKKARKPVTRP